MTLVEMRSDEIMFVIRTLLKVAVAAAMRLWLFNNLQYMLSI